MKIPVCVLSVAITMAVAARTAGAGSCEVPSLTSSGALEGGECTLRCPAAFEVRLEVNLTGLFAEASIVCANEFNDARNSCTPDLIDGELSCANPNAFALFGEQEASCVCSAGRPDEFPDPLGLGLPDIADPFRPPALVVSGGCSCTVHVQDPPG